MTTLLPCLTILWRHSTEYFRYILHFYITDTHCCLEPLLLGSLQQLQFLAPNTKRGPIIHFVYLWKKAVNWMYMEVDKIGGCVTKKREGKVRKHRAFNKKFEKFTIFADFVSNYLVLKEIKLSWHIAQNILQLFVNKCK